VHRPGRITAFGRARFQVVPTCQTGREPRSVACGPASNAWEQPCPGQRANEEEHPRADDPDSERDDEFCQVAMSPPVARPNRDLSTLPLSFIGACIGEAFQIRRGKSPICGG
jgi:hypothetical protein